MYDMFYEFISSSLWGQSVSTEYGLLAIEVMTHISMWLIFVVAIMFVVSVFRFFSGFLTR